MMKGKVIKVECHCSDVICDCGFGRVREGGIERMALKWYTEKRI